MVASLACDALASAETDAPPRGAGSDSANCVADVAFDALADMDQSHVSDVESMWSHVQDALMQTAPPATFVGLPGPSLDGGAWAARPRLLQRRRAHGPLRHSLEHWASCAKLMEEKRRPCSATEQRMEGDQRATQGPRQPKRAFESVSREGKEPLLAPTAQTCLLPGRLPSAVKRRPPGQRPQPEADDLQVESPTSVDLWRMRQDDRRPGDRCRPLVAALGESWGSDSCPVAWRPGRLATFGHNGPHTLFPSSLALSITSSPKWKGPRGAWLREGDDVGRTSGRVQFHPEVTRGLPEYSDGGRPSLPRKHLSRQDLQAGRGPDRFSRSFRSLCSKLTRSMSWAGR
mmetsp:Transcript_95639/g.270659  ORF Transcript_95639/g.270659 Transcript_95639/m.270659 type:complete len:345 (-) Transcript_95639:102-1136(-)